ncbi:MAG: hypothetical protein SFY81_14785 [Verrucomicrobiota bacterium]|nr:hypothetical protein [Verrucomicrobiota bacterium]
MDVLRFSLLLGLSFNLFAAVQETVERGAHHRVVRSIQPYLREDSSIVQKESTYVELQNGMNYLENGVWRESQDLLELQGNFVVATKGPIKLILNPDIHAEGAVDILSPDGKRFRSTPLAITYRDASSDETVILGRLKPSRCELISSNQAIYPDAFDGIKADVIVTYTRSSLEVDVVLQEKPLNPEEFGIPEEQAQLEIITEFFNAPVPHKEEHLLDGKRKLKDQLLRFGDLTMIRGNAFKESGDLRNESAHRRKGHGVAKEWREINKRKILQESVRFKEIANDLADLPQASASMNARKEKSYALFEALQIKRAVKHEKAVASTHSLSSGFVMDWVLAYDLATNFTFASNTTYYIRPSTANRFFSGGFGIGGTAVFEANAVIKFNPNSDLYLYGQIYWANSAGRTVFTGAEDDSVGERLQTGYNFLQTGYAKPALWLYYNNTPMEVRNCEIRLAQEAIRSNQNHPPGNTNKIINCFITGPTQNGTGLGTGIIADNCTLSLSQVTICQETMALDSNSNRKTLVTINGGLFQSTDVQFECVNTCLTFTQQPQSAVKNLAGSVTFTAATFGGSEWYQWFFNDTSIPGANTYFYTKNNLTHADAGEYWVMVYGPDCQARSDRATLTINGKPTIQVQPVAAITCEGGEARFSVKAIGTGTSTYQWRKNGVDIPGATAFELLISNAASSDAAAYSVVVSNPYGSTTSSSANLTLTACASKVFTANTDFNVGLKVGLNSVSGSLRMTTAPGTSPHLTVACSGRNTVARIDTGTGRVVGEYRTAPPGIDSDPSRTTVDFDCNVWLGNREDNLDGQGSIMKLGIVLGGTRGKVVNGSFIEDPKGNLLKPPFIYNTCEDRNHDGYIQTSYGLTDVRDWPTAPDFTTEVPGADDEAILRYHRVAPVGVRTVAVAADGTLWIGGDGKTTAKHVHLDPNTGNEYVIYPNKTGRPRFEFTETAGGYGGLIDGQNVLWSAGRETGLLYLPLGGSPINFSDWEFTKGRYALAIDPASQEVWHTHHLDGTVTKMNFNNTVLGTFPTYPPLGSIIQGLAVDNSQNVWVGHGSGIRTRTIARLKTTDGMFVGNVDLWPHAASITGLAVDNTGKVWASGIDSDNIVRLNPNAGSLGTNNIPIGVIDLITDLGDGARHTAPDLNYKAAPYNYSDMTGQTAFGATRPSGFWNFIHTACKAGAIWSSISWTQTSPTGTSIVVQVRAHNAETELPFQPWVNVTSGSTLNGLVGKYLEIKVTFRRPPISSLTAVLDDLTIACPTY